MDATIGDPRTVVSVERVFDSQPLPGVWGQLTLRGMCIAVVLGTVFGFVGLRIQMTSGIVPSLAMPISVLSFFFLKWLIRVLATCGLARMAFTRQETVLILTTVSTCLNTSVSGGFANYIIGMSSTVAKSLDANPDPRDMVDYVSTGHWMLFIFIISLMGILITVPLIQVMIIDYRLLFPSGTVQAHLINSFHTPQGAYVAKLQVAKILKFFLCSFSWTSFSWFYASGKDCGFSTFPMFGLHIYNKYRFYFDFSPTYIGLGMICPHLVNIGLLFGAILSSGFLFPFLESKNGQWYHTDSTSSLKGMNGYKVFICAVMIVTDGIFNFFTLIITASLDFKNKMKEKDLVLTNYFKKHPSLNYDDRKRIEVFLENRIPVTLPVAGYIAFAIISTVVIPWLFDQIKYYHVAALYAITPIFSFCNTYAGGLTDWSISPTYAKFVIFIIAAWIGKAGAVVASLVACGVIMAGLHVGSQAMNDLKIGYMTLTSPRAIVTGQIFGVTLGCIISPCIFLAFQSSGKNHVPIGSPQSEYPCPYAGMYRAIGVIGMGGVKELPDYCLLFCFIAFCVAIAIDTLSLISQRNGWTIHNYIPSVTVIALPFIAGSHFAIGMCIGSAVIFTWTKMNRQSADILASAVAAGLICGEGIFALPQSILSMFNVQPPMCMKFLPSGKEVEVVDKFLSSVETPIKT